VLVEILDTCEHKGAEQGQLLDDVEHFVRVDELVGKVDVQLAYNDPVASLQDPVLVEEIR
jgi:hypothetical protein